LYHDEIGMFWGVVQAQGHFAGQGLHFAFQGSTGDGTLNTGIQFSSAVGDGWRLDIDTDTLGMPNNSVFAQGYCGPVLMA
jgi:hypothetical protein